MKRLSAKSGVNFDDINPRDLIATATELSGKIIAEHILKKSKIGQDTVIYVSGGGAHNPALMETIGKYLGSLTIHNFSKLGINPDAKEALIFAVLANETLAGNGFTFTDKKGIEKKIQFGKISFPI